MYHHTQGVVGFSSLFSGAHTHQMMELRRKVSKGKIFRVLLFGGCCENSYSAWKVLFLIMKVGLMRILCGGWIKLCVGRAREADQSEPAHTSAFSGI